MIVGLGGIGAETARLLSAFGMSVLAVDARRTAAPEGVAELHPPEGLDQLLPQADFVILTVPHTPATEGFFNTTAPANEAEGVFHQHRSRHDDEAGRSGGSAKAGEIAGAALDVYEQEPLPPEHPLWGMPNVLLTPHMAGYGPYLNERRLQIIQYNCRAFAAGRPLRNQVDKSSWF